MYMRRTPASRFDILRSIFSRHDRACRNAGGSEPDHDLSNVKSYDDHLHITTKSGHTLKVSGSSLLFGNEEIPISEIEEIDWISPESSATVMAKLKRERYDDLFLKHHGKWVPITGLGQSVFPLMQFLHWAREYG